MRKTFKMRLGLLSRAAVAAGVGAILLAACSGGGQASEAGSDGGDAETFTIKIGHVLAESEPIHKELLATAERVAERTDGNVTLEVFPNSQLGGNADLADQAVQGDALIAHEDVGYVAEHDVPELAITQAPFLYENADQLMTLVASPLFQGWEEKLEADGDLVSLAWNWYFGARHVISKQGFPEPADIEGVSVRVPPNKVWLATFSALGTVPTQLEWSEVYSGLSEGVVDAAEAPLTTLYGSKIYESAKTITLTGHFQSTTGFVVGKKYWDTLPEEYQKVLTEEFTAGGENVTSAAVANDEEVRKQLEAEGVTFVEANHAAYQAAVEDFYKEFPEWPADLKEQVVKIIND